MRLLLLNNNPAVSRLIKLSVDKVGYEMDEFEDYGLVPLKAYDVIMVDNECYEEEELGALCEHSSCEYVVYICQRGSKKPDFANVALEKPFLPTDFLLLLEKIKNVLESLKPQVQAESRFTQSEPLHEEISSSAFDIDAIDTFGVESPDNDALSPFEELPQEDDEFANEPLMEEVSRKDDDDDESALDLPLFDMQEDEMETLDLDVIKTQDDEEDDNSLNSFDFEEKPLFSEPLDALEEESTPCILDRDDINEVKQLLDESDEEENGPDESFNFESPSSEEISLEERLLLEEEGEEDPFVVDDVTLKAEELSLPLEEEMKEAFLEETPFVETQEELINDFEESVEESIEEEASMTPLVEITLAKPLFNAAFESIDDLNENAIKKAFGEEVDEAPLEDTIDLADASMEPKESEAIRGEIENTIARSLSGLAQSDVLREALKGMRINISITFDEKN